MTEFKQSNDQSSKGMYKRDALREIELKMQQTWREERLFECDAPSSFTAADKDNKFMVTFPYPYMNGRLHLGHSFSLSKAEFAAGFERMQGKRVLFPFAFHCTGMPIKAAADKLAKEIKQFGCPPKFPSDGDDGTATSPLVSAKHSKVAAKTGGVKYQWQIMEQLDIPSHEIHKFADPAYWTKFFPPACQQDLCDFGAGIDWRRSFITTDLNPFYDAFIQWQFRKLKAQGKITFGKRYCIYSPLDAQPCMDHDRASGEGVDPKEYTAIKLQLLQLPSTLKHLSSSMKVFLVAATLRPETMYGQTNCWVGSEIEYGAFQVSDQEVFVCTERAALNMAFQGYSLEHGKVSRVGSVMGADLIGSFVLAPLCVAFEQRIPILPMMSVVPTVGTGIVTSVPASSADDFAALRDLKEKEPLRRKFNLSDSHVLPFSSPIPVVKTAAFGDLGAETLVKQLGVKSQNDRDLLDKAKEQLYKEEFYSGVMMVGEFAEKSVQEAKPLVRKLMIDAQTAFPYYEPERRVVSRSGDDCVVCLTDQWFIAYGESGWRGEAEKALAKMNCFLPEVRHQFESTLAWMQQWACSRSFGLGSKLPWDPQYLIESLSDSTIYMAFYTIAHVLHQGSFDGSVRPFDISVDQMTDAVFDYIFSDATLPKDSNIPVPLLERMRGEFRYFYPLDLRVSGKDLVPNHLTFFLYNHVALFDEEFWPCGVRANGHLLLNGQKMSKSTGNFMTMAQACQQFGADATRIALADAGDGLEDANFVEDSADKAILRLFSNLDHLQSIYYKNDSDGEQFREKDSDYSFFDKAFDAEMDVCTINAVKAYKSLNFRDALHAALFGLQNARDFYRDVTCVHGSSKMHWSLMDRFAKLSCQLMAPITPHYCDYVWRHVINGGNNNVAAAAQREDGKTRSIFQAGLPSDQIVPDQSILAALAYVKDTCYGLRAQISTNASKMPERSATLFVANVFPKWQEDVIATLKQHLNSDDTEIVKALKPIIAEHGKVPGVAKKIIPFAMELKKQAQANIKSLDRSLPFEELNVIQESADYLTHSLGLLKLDIVDCSASSSANHIMDAEVRRKMEVAEPGRPSVRLF